MTRGPDFTLCQIRDLVLAVENGSIRAAALASDCSQAAISRNISRLESQLGVELLVRSASGISPTATGRRLAARGRLILRECERLDEEVDLGRSGADTMVSLGVSPAAAVLLVPQAVREFGRHYPRAQLRLATAIYENILPRLRLGEFDFAISPIPASPLPNDLLSTFLFRSRHAIIGHSQHPARRARSLRELIDARWVVIGSPGQPGGSITIAFRRLGLPDPHIVAICESLTQVFALLSEGDVVASVPRILVERGFSGRDIREIPVAEPLPEFDVCLLRRRGAPESVPVRTMASIVASYAAILRGNPAPAGSIPAHR
ncbi:MAG: LysR family transcriptional regulator [Burkholderiaceae bacterium]|nr:LysR family transcriptional regulator [Burkholderiaceae bacterium]